MKQLLITIAAVLLVGCGETKLPDISIHEAASEGNIEAVKQHIIDGIDVNIKNTDGESPLHYAAGSGHKEVVELLIARGADVNAKIKNSITPLDFAIDFKQSETAELLRKHGGKTRDWFKARESIHIAARDGNIEAVKQHLAAGTDVNAKHDVYGGTSLEVAAVAGHKEIVELLISEGADVNVFDGYKKTPLDYATDPDIPTASGEMADLLRKHGAKTGEELKAAGN